MTRAIELLSDAWQDLRDATSVARVLLGAALVSAIVSTTIALAQGEDSAKIAVASIGTFGAAAVLTLLGYWIARGRRRAGIHDAAEAARGVLDGPLLLGPDALPAWGTTLRSLASARDRGSLDEALEDLGPALDLADAIANHRDKFASEAIWYAGRLSPPRANDLVDQVREHLAALSGRAAAYSQEAMRAMEHGRSDVYLRHAIGLLGRELYTVRDAAHALELIEDRKLARDEERARQRDARRAASKRATRHVALLAAADALLANAAPNEYVADAGLQTTHPSLREIAELPSFRFPDAVEVAALKSWIARIEAATSKFRLAYADANDMAERSRRIWQSANTETLALENQLRSLVAHRADADRLSGPDRARAEESLDDERSEVHGRVKTLVTTVGKSRNVHVS